MNERHDAEGELSSQSRHTPGNATPRREMREEDDTPIPWSDELPPRIDEGEYDAVVRSMRKVTRFRLATVETWWRLLLPDSREKIELYPAIVISAP